MTTDARMDAVAASPAAALGVELQISASSLTVAERGAITVGFTIHNLADHAVDPHLATSELRVDGQPQRAWSMALLNSGHDATWTALPAGDHLTSRYRLGAALFPEPGTYTVELTVAGVTSPPVVVRVDP